MAKKPSLNDLIVHSQTRATWIASIVSAIALVVSLFSLYESHETRMANLRDELLIRARRPMGEQPITIKKMDGKFYHGSVTVPWEVLISNTGSSTASITGYKVLQVADLKGVIDYSGLDSGLFSPETNQAVPMPITLEAGRSIRLLLFIGINPGTKAYTTLLAAVGDKQATIPLYTAEKILAKNGLDLYDNPVVPIRLPTKDEVSGWRVEQQGKEQVFLFKFHTARGVETSEVTSWYDIKQF